MILSVYKKTDFTAKGTAASTFCCSYKGRSLYVNTLNFMSEPEENRPKYNDKDKTVEIQGSCDIRPAKVMSRETGQPVTLLQVMPKLDLDITEY